MEHPSAGQGRGTPGGRARLRALLSGEPDCPVPVSQRHILSPHHRNVRRLPDLQPAGRRHGQAHAVSQAEGREDVRPDPGPVRDDGIGFAGLGRGLARVPVWIAAFSPRNEGAGSGRLGDPGGKHVRPRAFATAVATGTGRRDPGRLAEREGAGFTCSRLRLYCCRRLDSVGIP